MEFGHMFECLMLVCFGFSWPLNVIKAYRARTAKGTSLAFIILIITGYLAGITAKVINHQMNYVLGVYILNLVIVFSNVVVYIRNRALDKKHFAVKVQPVAESKVEIETYSQEENMNYKELNGIANANGVILVGGSYDKLIPVTELSNSFEFNFDLYNRSQDNLSVKNAKDYFLKSVAALAPEGLILHLGQEDISLFQSNPSDFDKYYLELLGSVKACNSKCRIALVSVNNENGSKVVENMNTHIKAIASSEKCVFVNLDNAKLWNPQATKASVDFAYGMGLTMRKPILDVAQVLYSYAYHELPVEAAKENLVS